MILAQGRCVKVNLRELLKNLEHEKTMLKQKLPLSERLCASSAISAFVFNRIFVLLDFSEFSN